MYRFNQCNNQDGKLEKIINLNRNFNLIYLVKHGKHIKCLHL